MPRFVRALLVLLALAAAVPACGGSSSSNPSPQRDPRLLTYIEVQEGMSQNVMNLYDLVATRKSSWLRPTMSRAPTGSAPSGGGREPTVWLDGVRLGGVQQLRTVALSVVVEARYLTPSEAQAQLGLNNLGGAIVISTRRD